MSTDLTATYSTSGWTSSKHASCLSACRKTRQAIWPIQKIPGREITHHELRTRATYAWKNYENSEGTEKNIRRITVHFLFPRTLEGNPLPGAIYEDFLMLLEQMFEIKEGLRTDFLVFLQEKIPPSPQSRNTE